MASWLMGAFSETTIVLLNISRYRKMLARAADEAEREKIAKLLAQEQANLDKLRRGLG